jgi:hypothetical protein
VAMNRPRPARIRTPKTPMTVQGRPPGKSSTVPEWASLAGIVTATTVFGFAASSFYVAGLASALDKPLAIYFSPADYLRITPPWAIPTLGLFALLLFFAEMHPAFTSSRVSLLSLVFDDTQNLSRRKPILFFLAFSLILLLLLFSYWFIEKSIPATKLSASFLVLNGSLIAFLILTVGISFVRVSTVTRAVLLIAPCSMFFALGLGSTYEPLAIKGAPLARVLYEPEKDRVTGVEGRIIFDLDRYLLILTESESSDMVAIPHEEIRSIQTPSRRQPEQTSAGD